VRDPKENVSWFGIAYLDESFQGFAEWLIASLVSLHDFARLLVDYDQMVVFVNNA